MEILLAIAIGFCFALWLRISALGDQVNRIDTTLTSTREWLTDVEERVERALAASEIAPAIRRMDEPAPAPAPVNEPLVSSPAVAAAAEQPSPLPAPRSGWAAYVPSAETRPRRPTSAPAAAPLLPWQAAPGQASRATVPDEAVSPSAPAVAWSAQPASTGPGLLERFGTQMGLPQRNAGEPWSPANLEAWLEGRMLAIVGGIALLLGAVFFLSVAISRGWIGPSVQVAIGLAAGAGLVVGAELLFARRHSMVGHVMVAVGLATVSLAFFAGTRLYGILPVELGLGGALLASAAAAGIAVRHDSQLVAAYGLIAVLGAPIMFGASPTIVTLLFVGVALVGTTAIALYRTWIWLPPLAFVLSAPQLISHLLGAPQPAEGLVAVAGFWLVYTIAAGGEEFRHPTNVLRSTSATLLLADAALVVWAGFQLLAGDLEPLRGLFLAVVAAAHLAVGLPFLARNGDRHPFGLLVTGTGVAALSMAIPVQLDGPPVPIAWAAEAAALAWVAVQRRHGFSALVGLLLGTLAVAHLAGIEYPLRLIGAGLGNQIPFVGPAGMTFAFLMGALLVAGVLARIAWVRAWLAIAGTAIAVYVLPFELSGPALVAGWMILAAAGVVVARMVVGPRLAAAPRATDASGIGLPAPVGSLLSDLAHDLRSRAVVVLALIGSAAGALAIGHLCFSDFPLGHLFGHRFPGELSANLLSTVPYGGPEGLSLVAVLLGFVAVAASLAERWVHRGLAGLGLLLVAYTLPFEVQTPTLIVAWGLAAVVSVGVARRLLVARLGRDPGTPARDAGLLEELAFRTAQMPYVAALAAIGGAVVIGLVELSPIDFLRAMSGGGTPSARPFLDEPTFYALVLAILAVALAAAWGGRLAPWVGGTVAGLIVAYLLPFELPLAAAVVAWSALAVVAFAVIRAVPAGRLVVGPAALGLLGLGGLFALFVLAPPARLVVHEVTAIDHPLLLSEATAALGSIALALAAIWALLRREPLAAPALGIAGVLLVYILSVGVVDEFQRQMIGVAAADVPWRVGELGKSAQTGLSVLWSVLGGLVFGAGLVFRRDPARRAGLALLGLATAKVFVVDLAYLDVLYRVLVLVALGGLLLFSAFLYEQMQRPHRPGKPRGT